MTRALAERGADDVVTLPDRRWELFDGEDGAAPSNAHIAHDDTRQFVLQKLQDIAEAGQNPLIAPKSPAPTMADAPRPAEPELEPEAAASEPEPAATEPQGPACPVTFAATEAVADSSVYSGYGPSAEVVEHLRQFRRRQTHVTALVFSAVGCASVATIGGIAYILV